ncbi:MAG: DUF1249 domain-containing protein [PS1 clade bacterium]|jgi:hypothetical protein
MAIMTELDLIRSLYNQQLPKTYNEVSDLFESNYIKLSKLIPPLELLQENHVLRQNGENNLYLFVESKSPYTSIYTLTHKLKSGNGLVCRPDLKFKVFFDAKLVEAISICNEHVMNKNHPFLSQCSDMDIQWELNVFLQRWLEYCSSKYERQNWETFC